MKYIVTDFDSTLLLKNEKELSKETKRAIERIIGTGNMLFVSSGRNYTELREYLKEYAEKIAFIPNEGAFYVKNENILFDSCIDSSLLYDFECENKAVFHSAYFSYVKSDCRYFIRRTKEKYFDYCFEIQSIDEINSPIYKISVFNQKKKHNLNLSYHAFDIDEYVNFGVDKGSALNKLIGILNAKKDAFYVIGDGENDIKMFENCENSFAVQTAKPKIKKMCKYTAASFKCAVDKILGEE